MINGLILFRKEVKIIKIMIDVIFQEEIFNSNELYNTLEHLKSMAIGAHFNQEGNKLTDVEIRELGVMGYRAMSGIMFVFIG